MFKTLEIEKWVQTIYISWTKILTYKFNFILIILGPALVFFFVKYNLWTSIYETGGQETIRGYSLNSMLQYQIWVLIVSLIGQGYTSLNLARDIRLGKISTYLIYPFNLWQFHTASFIGFVTFQLLVSALTLFIIGITGILPIPSAELLIKGTLLTCLVSLFWYCIQFYIGLLAFWLEETWIIRVLVMNISAFLSGAIVPLEIYPKWFFDAIQYTPFPYVTYVPVRILMGEYEGSILIGVGYLSFWTIAASILSYFTWKKGIRLYTAAGM